MVRFIHSADIHLDSPLRGLQKYEGAPVDEIRGATRRALENLVELAMDREVDFVLIAGDLYDGDWKDQNTGLFFVAQMIRLRESVIPVVLISGNHDAANRMTRTLRLPDNVELLSHTRPTTSRLGKLGDLGVAVHGQSFGKPAQFDNLAEGYARKQAGMLNIGLLHTSLDGAAGHEPYAPCTLEDLRRKDYDYWALGHVHARKVRCDDPPIVFPGNVQGRHIREAGAKGCYLVTADEQDRCRLEFVPLDVFRWELCRLDATQARRPEDVLDDFANQLARLDQSHDGLPLAVRVEVTGPTAAHDALRADPRRWTSEIRAAALQHTRSRIWIEKVGVRTTPHGELTDGTDGGPIGALMEDVAELRADPGQLGELAELLKDLQRRLPDELTHGAEALRFEDPDQLQQWIDEVEPLLLNRLRGGVGG
ncbi:MAG: DNA repair exonuclease [Planctomycetota bacterium]